MNVLVLGFMLDLLNVTVVNVALPAIKNDLGGTASQVGWIATAYLLALAVTLITAARLGDLWGRKRMFLTGLGTFALAAAWSAVARSPGELIAARAAQGVAAGLLAPQVMSIIYTLFRGRERATVLGIVGVVAGVAQAVGLMLGGLLIAADVAGLGWRSVFWISVPLALVLLGFGAWLIPESRAPGAVPPRWLPTTALTLGLVAIVFSLLEGHAYGWALWILVVLIAGIALVAVVAFGEHHNPARRAGALLPLGLVRERTSGLALLIQLSAFAAFSGFLLVFTLWLQDAQGYTPLAAGTVTISFSVGCVAVARWIGRLTVRFGRFTVLAGTILGVLGTLAVLGAATTATYGISPWLLAPGLFVIGIGLNLTLPPVTTLYLSAVPPAYAGSASGLWNTSQQFGGAIGVASLSSVFFGVMAAWGYPAAFAASALTVIGILMLSAALALALPARSHA